MKINIPRIVVPVDLGGYAEELRGKILNVWVNMPNAMLSEHTQIVVENEREIKALLEWQKEPKGEMPKLNNRENQFHALYAAIWSEGAEETRWTAEELRELEAADPALFGWMISETWNARREHIDRRKKA